MRRDVETDWNTRVLVGRVTYDFEYRVIGKCAQRPGLTQLDCAHQRHTDLELASRYPNGDMIV